VAHGAKTKAEPDKIQSISVAAKEIARRTRQKIAGTPGRMEQFHTSKSELDEDFLKAAFGGANQNTTQRLTPAHES
jgi:hypothetical protein